MRLRRIAAICSSTVAAAVPVAVALPALPSLAQDPPVGNAQIEVDLATESKAAIIRTRRIRVTVSSDQPVGFRATAVLRSPGRVILSQQFGVTLDGGGAEQVKSIPVSARARRSLKSVRKGLKLVVEGTATDAAGAQTPVEQTLRIKQR